MLAASRQDVGARRKAEHDDVGGLRDAAGWDAAHHAACLYVAQLTHVDAEALRAHRTFERMALGAIGRPNLLAQPLTDARMLVVYLLAQAGAHRFDVSQLCGVSPAACREAVSKVSRACRASPTIASAMERGVQLIAMLRAGRVG